MNLPTQSVLGMSLLVSYHLMSCFSWDALSSSHRSWLLLSCCSSEFGVSTSRTPSAHCFRCLIYRSCWYWPLFLRLHKYHSWACSSDSVHWFHSDRPARSSGSDSFSQLLLVLYFGWYSRFLIFDWFPSTHSDSIGHFPSLCWFWIWCSFVEWTEDSRWALPGMGLGWAEAEARQLDGCMSLMLGCWLVSKIRHWDSELS